MVAMTLPESIGTLIVARGCDSEKVEPTRSDAGLVRSLSMTAVRTGRNCFVYLVPFEDIGAVPTRAPTDSVQLPNMFRTLIRFRIGIVICSIPDVILPLIVLILFISKHQIFTEPTRRDYVKHSLVIGVCGGRLHGSLTRKYQTTCCEFCPGHVYAQSLNGKPCDFPLAPCDEQAVVLPLLL